MPKVNPMPASATRIASVVQPWSCTTADRVATVPTTPSPRAMIAISPYRSAMWLACHGVPPARRSAITGPSISTPISTATINSVTNSEVCAKMAAIHPS